MFGFNAFIGRNNNPFFDLDDKGRKYICTDGIVCESNMVPKFENDKLFFVDHNFVVILDGVVLNKDELMKVHKCDTWQKTILTLYAKNDAFFNEFRGSFSGLIFEKKKKRLIVYSDHIGSKFIYYTQTSEGLFVTSMMPEIYKFLKANSLSLDLDMESAYMLLTYGYMLGNKTLCLNSFKLNAGCYLIYEDGKLKEERYCLLDNTPDYSITEKTAIDLIDHEFRRAVKLEFDKDDEYGYKHLVSLSAGLDSRMTSWIAHTMGYTNQINLTFSQSNYLDETIPQRIASDLKHEWIFKSLDDGNWLCDANIVTDITGGNAIYYGLAHSNSILRYLNFNDFGMIHSGQLGDVVIGTFYDSLNPKAQFSHGDGAYSKKLINKLSNVQIEKFSNQEIAKFYYRGFNGANCGQQITFQYTETCSPFMDWDVMNNILKIPLGLRYSHNIYKKWILKCYPEASKYIWERIGCRINRKFGMINYRGHSVRIEALPRKVALKLFPQLKSRDTKNMNPLGYYLNSNEMLQNYINGVFDSMPTLIDSKELLMDLYQIKKSGTPIEIIEAVSLIKGIELMRS